MLHHQSFKMARKDLGRAKPPLKKCLWHPLTIRGPSMYQHHIQRLQRLQNREVCMIFSLNKFDHVMEYYKQLQWLNLNQLIQFCLACVMFHQFHKSKGIL